MQKIIRAAALLASIAASAPVMAQTFVYVSEADDGTIARYALNEQTGALNLLGRTKTAGKVMPMALSADRTQLYAAIRSKPLQLESWHIDSKTGDLSPSSSVNAAASYPYISTDPQGRFLLGASYDGDVVHVYRLASDGKVIAPPVGSFKTGHAAHSVIVDARGENAYVGNLGTDRVLQLKLSATGELTALGNGYVKTAAENGPRHSVLSPDNRYLYNIGEMGGIITQFRREASGELVKVAETPNAVAEKHHLEHGKERPANYSDPTPRIWAADIRMTPDGRFLYVSERTSSTISGYRVNKADGKLTLIDSWQVEKQPRGMAITSDGRWLIASGEKSTVTGSYAIDPQSGALKRVGEAPAGRDANWVTTVTYAEHCTPEDFGGKADGKKLNTAAIQQAIDQCSQRGGGTVQLSPGRWLSGPLQLQSNITLQIDQGATLQASNQEGKFVNAFIGHPARVNEAFIYASNVNNVAITGGGTLDGDGEKSWWPQALKIRAEVRGGNPKAFTDRFPGIPLANGAPRPWFIEFNNVSHSKIEQLHLTNSPMWNIVIRNSADINVQNVRITNPVSSPNTDGMDIVSSRNITVSNMDIHTGDDNIAIKSGLVNGTAAASKDITIEDSVMRDGHGISVGSETANGIGKVTINHVTFLNTENGVRIKSARDRGENIGPLIASHLTMTNVVTPVLVTNSYSGQAGAQGHTLTQPIETAAVTASTPKMKGIHISDLMATKASYAMIFSGLPESPVEDVTLNNIRIDAQYGVQARYVSGEGKNITLTVKEGETLAKGPDTSLTLN